MKKWYKPKLTYYILGCFFNKLPTKAKANPASGIILEKKLKPDHCSIIDVLFE